MKKLTIFFLAFLYLATASGATVNIHYCMGKFVEIGFGHSDSEECGSCGMTKTTDENNCCKEEQKIIKVDNAHKSAETFFNFIQLPSPDLIHSETIIAPLLPSITHQYPVVNAPPVDKEAAYLLNRSIRI